MRGLVAALAVLPGLAQGQTTGHSWDWQLSERPRLAAPVDILDLDPDAVTAAEVARLNAQGILTICYVSVGTLEDWRSDRAAFPRAVLGRDYDGWEGESFLDIRQLDILLPLMQARFSGCRAKGFAAIEPDNIDLHINDTGFDLTGRDVVAYVRALAGIAHDLGLKIGQKNAPDLTTALEPSLDFIVTEGCYADDWCDEVLAYARSGKAILAAEYDLHSRDRPAACAYAVDHGLSMIFKSPALDRSGSRCP